MTVADRMAVFMEGRVVQVGTPKGIYLRPASVAVASFIGTPPMNLLPAELADGSVELAGVRLPVDGAAGQRGRVTLGVRPNDLRIADDGMPAQVEFIEDLGDSAIILLRLAGQQIKMKTDQAQSLQEGQQVFLRFNPAAAHLFDHYSGLRL
jgi:multiple sugar transport system ATP-binding protein